MGEIRWMFIISFYILILAIRGSIFFLLILSKTLGNRLAQSAILSYLTIFNYYQWAINQSWLSGLSTQYVSLIKSLSHLVTCNKKNLLFFSSACLVLITRKLKPNGHQPPVSIHFQNPGFKFFNTHFVCPSSSIFLCFFFAFWISWCCLTVLFSHVWFLRFGDKKKKKNSSFQFFFCASITLLDFFIHRENVEEIKNSISLMLCHFHSLRSTVFDFSYFLLCFHLFVFVSLESSFVFITSSSLANCKLYVSVYYI